MKFSMDDWSALYLSETNNDHAPIDDLSAQRLQTTFANFRKRVSEKYKKCQRKLNRLYTDPWLKEKLDITVSFIAPPKINKGKGAPRKKFSDLGQDSRRKIFKNTTAGKCINQLISAVEYKARLMKKNDLCFILKRLKNDNNSATELRKLLTEKKPIPEAYSPKEAVALMLENSLSRKTYQALRRGAKQKNHGNLYPTYNSCLAEKKNTYPDAIKIGEYHKHDSVVLMTFLCDLRDRQTVRQTER